MAASTSYLNCMWSAVRTPLPSEMVGAGGPKALFPKERKKYQNGKTAVSRPYSKRKGRSGFQLRGAGVDRAPWLDPPPFPQKGLN